MNIKIVIDLEINEYASEFPEPIVFCLWVEKKFMQEKCHICSVLFL